jgi:hypothetical protein
MAEDQSRLFNEMRATPGNPLRAGFRVGPWILELPRWALMAVLHTIRFVAPEATVSVIVFRNKEPGE